MFLPGEVHVLDDALPVTTSFFMEVVTLILDTVLVVFQLSEFFTQFFAESGDRLVDGAQLIVRRARTSAQDGCDNGQKRLILRHFRGHVGGEIGHDGNVGRRSSS